MLASTIIVFVIISMMSRCKCQRSHVIEHTNDTDTVFNTAKDTENGYGFYEKNSHGFNYHDILSRIGHDKKYRVTSVQYERYDSSLLIIVDEKNASIKYFDTAYHLRHFRYIDGATLANTDHIQLGSFSKLGERLIELFKKNWCVDDICLPFKCKLIEENNKRNYTGGSFFQKLEVHYVADSSFFVRNYYYQYDANGSKIFRRMEGHVDFDGNVLTFENRRL